MLINNWYVQSDNLLVSTLKWHRYLMYEHLLVNTFTGQDLDRFVFALTVSKLELEKKKNI